MRKIDTNAEASQLLFLDGLRGLAAFYVMVGHSRWLLWEGYSSGFLAHPDRYSVFEKLLVHVFSMFKYGYNAVLFFFVLSGFVIHLRYAKKLKIEPRTSVFDWGLYVLRRAKRLYPPLIFAMAVTFVCDMWGLKLGYGIYHQMTPYPLINQNVTSVHTLFAGIGNLLFLMNTYTPVWGSNGPLWTLKYEWWFYMIYPIFWFLSKKSIFISTAIMMALYIFSFFPQFFLGRLIRDVFSMMVVWWLGVLLADIYTGRLMVPFRLMSWLMLFLPILLVVNPVFMINDLFWGLAFTGFLSFCFFLKEKNINLSIFEFFKPLGDMSYTLYLVHSPVLVLISGWLMSRHPKQLLPGHLGWVFFGIALSLCIAYAAHFFVEKPFVAKRVRMRIERPCAQ